MAAPFGIAQAQVAGQTPPPDQPSRPEPPPLIFVPDYTRAETLRRQEFDFHNKLMQQETRLSNYRMAREFADCAERISPGRVAALLNKPLASSAERRAAYSLMRFAPGCLGQSVYVSIPLLRGAVAEAALHDVQIADPKVATQIDSERVRQFSGATPGNEEGQEEIAAFSRFTQCQVLLAPGLVRDLLGEDPASTGEKSLRGKLADATKACGNPIGSDEEAAVVHRSYLAEALYHWTRSGENKGAS
ncbi:hypothetical protein GRI89_08480 [Altererythrobacter salegens]|uniref:Uncharacterized protein n=1 Tax=Croceibacterium salegens TaxID=1737568 RepID=A0A6I4SXJ2_9SPHN|nr:hypothetical protein [Croceibacterium salegens]MXO59576.1 hypothetical protein [Croceibacterium salegens]